MTYHDRNGAEINPGDKLRSINTGEEMTVFRLGSELCIIERLKVRWLTNYAVMRDDGCFYLAGYELVSRT